MSWAGGQEWLRRAERWRPEKVEPLRLRAWLASPIGWDFYMPLMVEGVLQFVVVWMEAKRSPDCVFADCPSDERVEIPIPIADVTIGGHVIACASNAVPHQSFVESVRYRRKRADVDAYNSGRITTSGGWAKSLNIACPTVVTPYIDFFVRGDRSKLAELVQQPCCVGLGRDIGRGLGTVLGWEIDDDPDDRSLVHQGVPQRILPLLPSGPYSSSSLRAGTWSRRHANLRAPYWKGRQETLCVIPTPWNNQ